MIRAFFAAEIGAEAREVAAALARRLRAAPGGDGVSWVRPEAYHLTLRFLGEMASDRLDALTASAREALAPLAPFRLRLAAPGAFPTPRRPRVLVIGVEPEAPLAALAARLEQAAVGAGLPRERRPFRAHLTLGRVRRGTGPPLVGTGPPVFEPGAASPPAAFEVAEVVLFRSRLDPGGSVYTPLARLPLEAQPHAAACQGPGTHDSPRTRSSKGDTNGQVRQES